MTDTTLTAQQSAPVAATGPNLYRKTALVQAEQFLPAEGKIPAGVISDGHGDPRTDARFSFVLQTLEGVHQLRNGDYICTGPAGEKWNVERSIFESTYECAAPAQVEAAPRTHDERLTLIRDHGDQQLIQDVQAGRVSIHAAVKQVEAAPQAERFERMFLAACADLGLINEELGLDPDDGGAGPIIDAIKALKLSACSAQVASAEQIAKWMSLRGAVITAAINGTAIHFPPSAANDLLDVFDAALPAKNCDDDADTGAEGAQQQTPEGDSFKPVYWFSVLAKCARLLSLPDDEPIPSGVLRAVTALTESAAAPAAPVLTRCAAASDGDCRHAQCPQRRDGEPKKSGRHCPLDNHSED